VARPRLVAKDGAAPGGAPVRFEGPPGNLQAVVRVPPSDRRSVAVSAAVPRGLGDGSRTLTAPLNAEWTTVRLLLPPHTPDGEYEAEVTWSGGTVPAVVVVRPHARVQVVPQDLRVSAAAGGTARASVVVHNAGNVPVDVRKATPVALEHENALDRAVVAGLTTDQTHLDRFGVAADSLAADLAGVARVVALTGAGTVAPGDAAQVDLEIRLPEGLEAGTTYIGTWAVGAQPVPLAVETTAAPSGSTASSRAVTRTSRSRGTRTTPKEKS
jgi:hypothetical protein